MSDVPPQGVKDENTRERMQHIARLVDEELPHGWGFVVMAFPFGDAEGRMNYVSNASREDIQKVMVEWMKKGGATGRHV